MSPTQHTHCANCQVLLQGSYCYQCGQQRIATRWTVPVLFRQFVNQLTNIEKGFLFTVKRLFDQPGRLIKAYWQGSTINYYNPFRYVLIWTAINILLNFWLGIDDLLQAGLQPEIVESAYGSSELAEADQRLDSWFNLLILLLIPVNSGMSRWLFKKHGQNYAEHLILNAFAMGQQALLGCFSLLLCYFVPHIGLFMLVNFLIGVLYNTYIFNRSFGEGFGVTLLKAIVIGLVGLLAFFTLILLFSAIALSL